VDLSQRKEQFSSAYVRAVASVAGFSLAKPEVDEDSIDFILAQRGGGGTIHSPRVEVQLKCTGRDIINNGTLHFPLKVKNYDDLRIEDVLVPRILVVLCVPENMTDWLDHTEEALLLHYCAYWASLRGMAPTLNTASVTIEIPQANVFSAEALSGIMGRVGMGELP
jgi:hypothetical protein